ncbi:hypothetical protein AD951_12670 [Acetobacter malorum]|uniref:Uncharacterized protein n=1 Tax=Acetobacter malorum TaxID=178901 RepID=A0A149UK98_9PROT|nr:hypothetical protein [Acetobacter malorum]KXV68166.1 hypothetical protein AD951_12670 [Acetobacter malorum]
MICASAADGIPLILPRFPSGKFPIGTAIMEAVSWKRSVSASAGRAGRRDAGASSGSLRLVAGGWWLVAGGWWLVER